MSVKGIGSPVGKSQNRESLFFDRRSHQESPSANGKRGTTYALTYAETHTDQSRNVGRFFFA